MSTLSELLAQLSGAAVAHLQRIVAERQLLADLAFADLLRWAPLGGYAADLRGEHLAPLTRRLISDPSDAAEVAPRVRAAVQGRPSTRIEAEAAGAPSNRIEGARWYFTLLAGPGRTAGFTDCPNPGWLRATRVPGTATTAAPRHRSGATIAGNGISSDGPGVIGLL